MTTTYSKDERLIAILFLMNFLFTKRTGLETGISENIEVNNDYKNLLIKSIKETHNLNFYQLPTNQISEYENILGEVMSSILNETPNNSIKEEIELIKKTVDADVSMFENINKFRYSDFIKYLLKDIRLSESKIVNLLKRPDFSRLYKYKNREMFFCTKKIRVKTEEKILFYILSNRFTTIEDQLMKNMYLEDIFLVSYRRFNHMLTSPVRLFLNLIDKYGIEIELNEVKKKIFLNTVSADSNNEIISYFFNKGKNLKKYKASGDIEYIGNNEYLHNIIWALNYQEYITDYKQGNI